MNTHKRYAAVAIGAALCFATTHTSADAPSGSELPDLGSLVSDSSAADTPGGGGTKRARLEWLLGGAVLNTPAYVGSNTRMWKPRPLWAVRYGRFSVSGPRANVGRTFDDDSQSVAGASAALFDINGFSASFGLRLDSGRKSSEDTKLTGLPDVKRRLLYSLNARYRLSDQWSVSASGTSDLRSAESGSTLYLGLGHSMRLAERWAWSSGAGLTFADNHYMQAYHGVSVVPRGSTLTLFNPSSGLRDVAASSTIRYQINRYWVGFGSLAGQQLLGDAARSPLTTNMQQVSVMFGLAYNSR